MSDSAIYSVKINVTFNPEFLKRYFADDKYGEVLGEVKMKELDIPVLSKGKFGLVIDGPFKGYKVKIVGYRGQVLPRTTQYTYEVRPWNIDDMHSFNKLELGIPVEDVVPYTKANVLLYGS